MNINELIELLKEIEEPYLSFLQKNFKCFPYICGIASHILLAYIKSRLTCLPDTFSIHFGEVYSESGNFCGLHEWCLVGSTIIDPTYEQYDVSFKNHIRITDKLDQYKSESSTDIKKCYLVLAKQYQTIDIYLTAVLSILSNNALTLPTGHYVH